MTHSATPNFADASENMMEATSMDIEADRKRLRAALDLVMVGGNHLASILIGKLGPDFASKYPPDLDTDSALRMLCATTEYDVWCCWSAIMRARTLSERGPVRNVSGETIT